MLFLWVCLPPIAILKLFLPFSVYVSFCLVCDVCLTKTQLRNERYQDRQNKKRYKHWTPQKAREWQLEEDRPMLPFCSCCCCPSSFDCVCVGRGTTACPLIVECFFEKGESLSLERWCFCVWKLWYELSLGWCWTTSRTCQTHKMTVEIAGKNHRRLLVCGRVRQDVFGF